MNTSKILCETLARIEGAYAPATIRAYRADFAAFIEFDDRIELIRYL